MAANSGERVRVILRKVQINDNLEPFFDEEGEFRFKVRVSSDQGAAQETTLPKEGYYSISDHPTWNQRHLNQVVFEGEVENRLEVEVTGEDVDVVRNDQLPKYRREFTGPPSSWIGYYGPGDEGENDPERMKEWWVFLEIQKA